MLHFRTKYLAMAEPFWSYVSSFVEDILLTLAEKGVSKKELPKTRRSFFLSFFANQTLWGEV